MTTLQIVLLSVAGFFALISLVIMIMFLFEVKASEKDEQEVEVKSIFSSENYVRREQKNESVDSMLAKLEETAVEETPVAPAVIEEVKTEEVVEEKPEIVEDVKPVEAPAPVIIEEVKAEDVVEEAPAVIEEVPAEEAQEEVAETPAPVDVEEVKEEAEEAQEEVVETPVEAEVEEVAETPVEVEEAKEEIEEVPETPAEAKDEETKVETQEEVVETEETSTTDEVVSNISGEMISAENLPDYKARLDKIIENRDKINKDLIKVEKSILNYERTKRRKLRNQKMLDRRASELTNLNLIMYSVTDIKNVDEEKKVKQEELTSHIAELKASIQDADEFLDSNKEKNDHDVKMAKFLIQEKARYNEEISELQKLIAKTEGSAQ